MSSRRTLLLSALLATTLLGSPGPAPAASAEECVFAVKQTADPERPYLVRATQERALLDSLAKNDVVFLGEHHNKDEDHMLQAKIILGLAERRGKDKVAIGLEMVQTQFQPALDAYVNRDIKDEAAAEKALYDGFEWAERWQVRLQERRAYGCGCARPAPAHVRLRPADACAHTKRTDIRGHACSRTGAYAYAP